MKTFIKITLSLLIIIGTFTACVDDTDFDTPQVNQIDNDISTSPFNAVKNALLQGLAQMNDPGPGNPNDAVIDPSTLIYTFADDSPVIIPAYVISDDTSGNFYKKLIVQDSPENPSAGLEITIDQGSLHTTYNVGRKIYIKMAGLSVVYLDGSQGDAPTYLNQSIPEGQNLEDITDNNKPGVYKIGVKGEDFTINRIPAASFENYIVRSSVSKTIVPQIITPTGFNDDTMNTFVQIDGMQFEIGELGKTFAGETGDSYDAERVLLNCDTEATFGLMTSTFSNFKSIGLPEEKGIVKGILAKNYREAKAVVVLNKYSDLDFTSTDRCDPIILDCGMASVEGTTDLMVENFDSGSIPATWTNYIQEGSRDWNTYSGSSALSGTSVRMGSYNSGDASSVSWLISPVINMDAQDGETLEFKTSNSYSDGSKLELMFSTDWDGTEAGIATATWGIIPAATIVDDGEYYQNWVSSGIVDLSCAEGSSFYIAFKYTGSGDSNFDGTYELDEINIKY